MVVVVVVVMMMMMVIVVMMMSFLSFTVLCLDSVFVFGLFFSDQFLHLTYEWHVVGRLWNIFCYQQQEDGERQ